MKPPDRVPPCLDIVLPCFNEAAVLRSTFGVLSALMTGLTERGIVSDRSCLWFVDDGSTDETWSLIGELADADRRVRGLRLSRNRGHQNAILAGLMRAEGDVVITMDADLQDDVACIESMIIAYGNGAQIVYGARSRRDVDTRAKRVSANFYYSLLQLIGMEVIHGHADFRLMSRAAIEGLRGYGESNLFLRGLIPELGFQSETVVYERKARKAGTSKYPLGKMIALSLDGITSFSAVPLRLIALSGFLIFLLSLVLVAYGLAALFVFGSAVPGWASTTVPMYALGGLQLLAMGVVGEYVAKIYIETKRRPRYIVEASIPASKDERPQSPASQSQTSTEAGTGHPRSNGRVNQ